MAPTPTEITLANLAGGALIECASHELRKICENIADPNCKGDAKRKLKIEVTIEPDERRQSARITYQVSSSVPGPDAGKTLALIGIDVGGSGSLALFEAYTQQPLPMEDHPPLVPLGSKQA